MDKKELMRILAGMSVAGLLAGAALAVAGCPKKAQGS
ncbi:MAG: selenobiotic family radical SAM modification target peptide [Deltaproteobacteria bacterium]|nr:selenobiotic family radical SAM modification target peptide [Deltaproteobacteria bacterium]